MTWEFVLSGNMALTFAIPSLKDTLLLPDGDHDTIYM